LLRHGMRSGRYSKPSNPANDNISAECGLLCAGFPCFTQYHHVHHKCHSSEICADYLDRLASRRTLAVSLHYVCLMHLASARSGERRGYSLGIWGYSGHTPLGMRWATGCLTGAPVTCARAALKCFGKFQTTRTVRPGADQADSRIHTTWRALHIAAACRTCNWLEQQSACSQTAGYGCPSTATVHTDKSHLAATKGPPRGRLVSGGMLLDRSPLFVRFPQLLGAALHGHSHLHSYLLTLAGLGPNSSSFSLSNPAIPPAALFGVRTTSRNAQLIDRKQLSITQD
jgi:hypothetical protein